MKRSLARRVFGIILVMGLVMSIQAVGTTYGFADEGETQEASPSPSPTGSDTSGETNTQEGGAEDPTPAPDGSQEDQTSASASEASAAEPTSSDSAIIPCDIWNNIFRSLDEAGITTEGLGCPLEEEVDLGVLCNILKMTQCNLQGVLDKVEETCDALALCGLPNPDPDYWVNWICNEVLSGCTIGDPVGIICDVANDCQVPDICEPAEGILCKDIDVPCQNLECIPDTDPCYPLDGVICDPPPVVLPCNGFECIPPIDECDVASGALCEPPPCDGTDCIPPVDECQPLNGIVCDPPPVEVPCADLQCIPEDLDPFGIAQELVDQLCPNYECAPATLEEIQRFLTDVVSDPCKPDPTVCASLPDAILIPGPGAIASPVKPPEISGSNVDTELTTDAKTCYLTGAGYRQDYLGHQEGTASSYSNVAWDLAESWSHAHSANIGDSWESRAGSAAETGHFFAVKKIRGEKIVPARLTFGWRVAGYLQVEATTFDCPLPTCVVPTDAHALASAAVTIGYKEYPRGASRLEYPTPPIMRDTTGGTTVHRSGQHAMSENLVDGQLYTSVLNLATYAYTSAGIWTGTLATTGATAKFADGMQSPQSPYPDGAKLLYTKVEADRKLQCGPPS